ncbi:MAG: hypothetical protein HC793_02065 [Aquincola sp.]|nr:hypothetical protein [Aquincola sp.]
MASSADARADYARGFGDGINGRDVRERDGDYRAGHRAGRAKRDSNESRPEGRDYSREYSRGYVDGFNEFRERTGVLDASRAAADDAERQQPLSFERVVAHGRQFELAENVVAQVHRLREVLQSERGSLDRIGVADGFLPRQVENGVVVVGEVDEVDDDPVLAYLHSHIVPLITPLARGPEGKL